MKNAARFLSAAALVLISVQGHGAPAYLELPKAVSPQEFEAVSSVFDPVQVFFIATASGSAVAFQLPDGQTAAPVFLDPATAEQFRQEEKAGRSGDTELDWRVDSMSWGGVYRYQVEQEASPEANALRFMMVPAQRQVEAAREISGDPNFNSVPVFIARRSSGEAFMTNARDGRRVIPLFLEADVLEATISRLAQSDAAQAADLTIEALPLESVVSGLASGTLEADKVSFVVPQATIEYRQAEKGR
jgi:hypothetical protein